MHAFRCKNCGHFAPAEHAGECEHPHACSACGAGISYDPKTGVKIFDTNNWEILCEATPERLKELGLDGEVERHVPHVKSGNKPKSISVETDNNLGVNPEA
jgi:hypothetical protein